jgi:hypothetical protein
MKVIIKYIPVVESRRIYAAQSSLHKNDIFNEYAKAFIKPKGLYAKVTTPDGYHVNYKSTLKKLLSKLTIKMKKSLGPD